MEKLRKNLDEYLQKTYFIVVILFTIETTRDPPQNKVFENTNWQKK